MRGEIDKFVLTHGAERQKLEAEQRQAMVDLGAAALPRLDAPSIAAIANTVGFPSLVQENVPARVEARRHWLADRLNQIARDPKFAQRELLRHPRTGSLTRALWEATENRKPFQAVIETCENHSRFERLWENGFGTPEHGTPWWRYSYWQDKSAAEAIAKSFPDRTFSQVRDEYARAKEVTTVYDGEIARLQAEIASGEALSREHAALYEEAQNLDARFLEHTRGRVVQHMLGIDASALSKHLASVSSPLQLLFLRTSGVTSKIGYLDQMQRQQVGEMQRELYTQEQKVNAVEQRTRRRWAPMPLDKFQKFSEDRSQRYQKRWGRFQKQYQTVYVYDSWDRGRYYEDLLWWDLMTRGRYDGSYIPEVSHFHEQNPDYAFNPNWKELQETYEPDHAHRIDTDSEAAAASIDYDHGSHDTSDSTSDAGDGLMSTDAS